jgi:hypothetical protein
MDSFFIGFFKKFACFFKKVPKIRGFCEDRRLLTKEIEGCGRRFRRRNPCAEERKRAKENAFKK